MKSISKILCASLFIQSAYAGGYFSVVQDSNIFFPSTVLVGKPSLAQYVVTNTSGATQSIHLNDLPSGFSFDSASACQPNSVLSNHASCTLLLGFTATAPITLLDYLPKVCPFSSTDVGCVAPETPMSFEAVTQLPSTAPTLSSSAQTVVFSPGETTVFQVENAGTEIANDVRVTLPTDILDNTDKTSSILSCNSIAPQGTCQFRVAVQAGLTNQPDTPFIVQGSNTNPLTLLSHINSMPLQTHDLTFTQPDSYTLTLTNTGGVTISNLSTTGALPSGVLQTATTCNGTLPSQSSCTITYNASVNAYGSTTLTNNFSVDGINKSLNVDLIVPETTVIINTTAENSKQGHDILASMAAGQFTVTNTGLYNWQNPIVERRASDTWLTLGGQGCNSGFPVIPNSTCSVDYTITGTYGLSTVISASGTNIQKVNQDFEPKELVSIGLEGDDSQAHLSASAVKVTNLTSSAVTLSNIQSTVPSNLSSNIIFCGSGVSNACSHAVSTCTSTAPLASNASCYFWYEATNHERADPLRSDVSGLVEGSLSLTATPVASRSDQQSQNLSLPIQFTYGNDLYVAFSSIPGVTPTTHGVKKWDGTEWSDFVTAQNGTILSLAMRGDDLYIGGTFDSLNIFNPIKYLAKWNGRRWSNLGADLFNLSQDDGVRSLTTQGDDLYVGGLFTLNLPDQSTTSNIAKWDGSAWSALGSGLNASVVSLLTTPGNPDLYAAGQFTQSGSTSLNRIAQWSGSAWVPLPSTDFITDMNSYVGALIMQGNALYIGGDFAANSFNNIAQLNNGQWNNLSAIFDGQVSAVAAHNSTLYAGGLFTGAVEQWNGTTWSLLNGGLSSTGDIWVNALATNGLDLYVGGLFTGATNTGLAAINVNSIAKWDSTTSTWSALGSDLPADSLVDALGIFPYLHLQ